MNFSSAAYPVAIAAVANLDGMVFRCRDDADWTMEFVGEGCFYLTGYRPDELLLNKRVSYQSITHPDDRQRVRDTIYAALAIQQGYEAEYRIIERCGDERWVLERGMAVRDQAGNVIALEGIITDITRLRRAEQRAREAELRYRSLFDHALEGIFRTTREGQYIDVNPALAKIYGFASPQELMHGVHDIRRQLYVDPQRREEFLFQIMTYGVVNHFESQVYRKDGQIIWISENARAIVGDNGELSCFEGTVEDITEQKHYQQSLIDASEAAHAANEAKSAFLANVSHEIRTPMNGVIGMTELLLATKMERVQRDYVETIRSSADALLTVINDILDFSKIEAGKLDIDNADMDLRATVDEVGGVMAFQAAAKQLELVVNISPEVPQRVAGDAQRIRQCLVNLAGNAIKFTSSGEVVISVSTAGVRNGRIITLFEVCDTGMGIAAETISTLFKPFVQADSSTTRNFGGTGLGLSIVKRLVELMDGEVGVVSEPGMGSNFWFTLPFEVCDSTNMYSSLTVAPADYRVLVVDDNQTNRRVVAGHLQHVGYRVTQAKNGAEALQLLHDAARTDEAFDVALVDLQMPQMDGEELGQRINGDPFLSRARVVMLTSMERPGDSHNFASHGFAGYLAKPIRARELYACVERVLGSESREWHTHTQPLITRGALNQQAANQRFIGRVLVVEDHPVNQLVIKSFLERYGCVVELAENGAEGVSLYQRSSFDLVFMDMQMPVMDGLTATRLIRDFEGWRPSTPIVALTANAMAGQAERCLAAGMDAFLTKPVNTARLLEILAQYLPRSDGSTVDMYPVQPTLTHEAEDAEQATEPLAGKLMDWDKFVDLVAGDHEFAAQLIEVFIASVAHTLADLQAAIQGGDRVRLQRAAHKLKGASANIGAETLVLLCLSLEAVAASASIEQLAKQVTEIVRANTQTVQEVQLYATRLLAFQ